MAAGRVTINVYDVFTLRHELIQVSTDSNDFFGIVGREMGIKHADVAFGPRGNTLTESEIMNLVDGDSVWIRSLSDDTRTTDAKNKIKLVVMGPGMVGKSAVTFRFHNDNFIPDHDATIEDFWSKEKIIDGQTIHLEILDTAGLEEYNNLDFSNWVNGKDGILLVYAINSKTTWTDIRDHHYPNCKEELGDLPPTIVLGNKADLADDRKVNTRAVEKKCEEWGVMFNESSAKTDHMVVESFVQLIRQILIEKNLYHAQKKKGFCTIL